MPEFRALSPQVNPMATVYHGLVLPVPALGTGRHLPYGRPVPYGDTIKHTRSVTSPERFKLLPPVFVTYTSVSAFSMLETDPGMLRESAVQPIYDSTGP